MTPRRRDRSGTGREKGPRQGLEEANARPGSGRAGSAPELAHEVALLIVGEGLPREIRAPALQEECGGDPEHTLAREAISHSQAGRLRCPVCDSIVERVFPSPGSKKRWHFRRQKGEGECDHEGETVQHRDSKTALAEALTATLPDG